MIYFFSDVHLGLYDRKREIERENKLLRFLNAIERDCERLFVVGDLFDYWFEYKEVIPKYYYRVLSALKDLRLAGVEIEYLMGNHDFGHKDFFENELSIPIHRNDITIELNGKKFYITHGDGKNNKDVGYKILKKTLRNPIAQKLYSWLHPDLGIWLASSSSQKSRKHTSKKQGGASDGMEDFAKARFKEGYDYFITGHRHTPTFKKFDDKIFVDLGDWLRLNPTFASFDGKELRLHNYEDFMSGR